MSQKELLNLKKEVLRLYNIFLAAYALEGSRGYRQDLRLRVESTYNAFNKANKELPEEHRIKSAISLKLSA